MTAATAAAAAVAAAASAAHAPANAAAAAAAAANDDKPFRLLFEFAADSNKVDAIFPRIKCKSSMIDFLARQMQAKSMHNRRFV